LQHLWEARSFAPKLRRSRLPPLPWPSFHKTLLRKILKLL
jgi:hypothetical protein